MKIESVDGMSKRALDVFAYSLNYMKEHLLERLELTLAVWVVFCLFNANNALWLIYVASYVDNPALPVVVTYCLLCICWLLKLSSLMLRPPDPSSIRWVVTVPAIWRDDSKRFMREAAHQVSRCLVCVDMCLRNLFNWMTIDWIYCWLTWLPRAECAQVPIQTIEPIPHCCLRLL